MTEQWIVRTAGALMLACPAAVALAGKAEWWVILLTFVGVAAGTVAGWRGVSAPADVVELDALRSAPPRADRHDQ